MFYWRVQRNISLSRIVLSSPQEYVRSLPRLLCNWGLSETLDWLPPLFFAGIPGPKAELARERLGGKLFSSCSV